MPPEPLTNFSPGQQVVVHTMPSSPNLALRLRELGMHEGGNFEVTIKSFGMMGVKLSNSNYALNQSITDQIIVDQYKALKSS